jgi:FlaA1/EpsC-like NDP-sugar epimerase
MVIQVSRLEKKLNTNHSLPLDELTAIATGRSSSLFQGDWLNHINEISKKTAGKRVLVLGGGGSIGASTVRVLSEFDLDCLHVVDHNENALAELVRDLRSRPEGLVIKDFRALPIDFGSQVMRRYLKTERPYDLVFNFAALKHVRSEKDVCSVLQMFDTNLLKPAKCWQWLQETGSDASYFSVSTDKAAEPVNLMGASKRIMEHVMFCSKGPMSSAKRISSSRFANVAFSNGSLLESFIQRFEKRQPIACPSDTRRFFISLKEAGQICALAAICGPDRHIMIPRLNPQDDARKLEDIAAAFLRYKGVEPQIYREEEAARHNMEAERLRNRFPLLITPLDTAGEKTCEKFVGLNEEVTECGMASILAVRYRPVVAETLADFLRSIESFVSSADSVVDKREIVEAVARVVPEFEHLERSQMLDQRM